ncbi:MAG: hypothetical protein MJ189_03945, partial [Coriobacteriales bacterium]|nr:hypothetical protein [Coriobacteriales bacterium]
IRTLSILVMCIGVATCFQSIKLQTGDIGNLSASLSWFVGLFNFVIGVSAYVLTCINNKGKNYIFLTIVLIAIVSCCFFMFEDAVLDIIGYIIVSFISIIVGLGVLFYIKFRLK